MVRSYWLGSLGIGMASVALAMDGRAAAPLLAAGIGVYLLVTLLLRYRPTLPTAWLATGAAPAIDRS